MQVKECGEIAAPGHTCARLGPAHFTLSGLALNPLVFVPPLPPSYSFWVIWKCTFSSLWETGTWAPLSQAFFFCSAIKCLRTLFPIFLQAALGFYERPTSFLTQRSQKCLSVTEMHPWLWFFFMLIYLIFKSAPTTQGSFQFNLNVSSRRHGRHRAIPGAPGMHESHSTTWVAWEGKWVVCYQALQIHKPQRSWEVVMGILVRKPFGEHERLFWAKEYLWTCVLLQWEGRAFRRGPWEDP